MTSTGKRMQFPFPLSGRRPGRSPALSGLEPSYLVSHRTLRSLSGLPGGTGEMREVAGSTLSGLIGQAIAREKGLSGLLDDYLNDWEAFKERFNPGPVRPGLTPAAPIRQAQPEPPRPLRMPIPGGPPVERTPVATGTPVLPCPGPTAAPVGPVGQNEYPLQDEQAKAKEAWEEAKKKGDQKDMEEAYRKYKEAFDKNQEENPLRAYMEQLAKKIEDETLNHPDPSDYGYKEAQDRIKATQEQMEGLWPGWYKAHLDWLVFKATGGQPQWYLDLKDTASTLLDIVLQVAPVVSQFRGMMPGSFRSPVPTPGGAPRAPVPTPGGTPKPVPTAPPSWLKLLRKDCGPRPVFVEPFPSRQTLPASKLTIPPPPPPVPTPTPNPYIMKPQPEPVATPSPIRLNVPVPTPVPTLTPTPVPTPSGAPPGFAVPPPQVTMPSGLRPWVDTSGQRYYPITDIQEAARNMPTLTVPQPPGMPYNWRTSPPPVRPPVATESPSIPRGILTPPQPTSQGPGNCPPGQFWDGRQCRGAIANIPGLPGLINAGGGGGAVAFPTMGGLGRAFMGCRSGSCGIGGRRG